ncbi:MAG: glycosyl hydrolase 53 family protein [Ruminococcus sp.]|nr:glycosyl hydrolase 53 family protein [Ruminococcus sp.]
MKVCRIISAFLAATVSLSIFTNHTSAGYGLSPAEHSIVHQKNASQVDFNDVWYNNLDPTINNGEPIKGVDISSILSLEKAGIRFYNDSGEPQDIFKTLSEKGVNYIRVRIWNQPFTNSGESYGGGNCDVRNAAEIGRRAAQYGMKLLADFQYSDFWADPEKQTVPKAWQGYDFQQKQQAIYDFTKESLKTISDAGADIGMVQVGNETNCFFCGETDMYKICDLFTSGCKAVREFDPEIMIALHFANPSTGYYDWYAKVLNECNVDYDVFATSYYPYWHGTTENLTNTLKSIGETYDKYVMAAETAYPYTNSDGDTFGNAVSESSSGAELRYEISVNGQAQCLSDVFQAIADTGKKGLGVFYWEPAWIGKTGISWEEQSRLWKEYGSGWATEYAAEYDKTASSAGGSSYDNQGLFDFNGFPLESLNVFSHIYPKHEKTKYPDGRYIKSLSVMDYSNAERWSVQSGLKVNDNVFGDRDYKFSAIPEHLLGAEWIRTACDSKKYTSSEATFTAGADITVYLALDSRITETPQWLNEWKKTEEVITDTGSPAVTYQLYCKDVKENEMVHLGKIGVSYAVNYIVAAVPCSKEAIMGDVDADGKLTAADVVMLQCWILGKGTLTNWEAADLCQDGTIDVFDLCLIKSELTKLSE